MESMPPGVAPIGSGSGISAAKQGGQHTCSAQMQLSCTSACRQRVAATTCSLVLSLQSSSARVDEELQVESQASLIG